MEEETGVLLPQDKDRQEPPETGKDKEELSPRAFGGSVALRTPWFWTSGLQNCERLIIYLFI